MIIRKANRKASITNRKAIQQQSRRKTWGRIQRINIKAAEVNSTFQPFAY